MDSIAIYTQKPRQLRPVGRCVSDTRGSDTRGSDDSLAGVSVGAVPAEAEPTFDLALEHRVWLAKFKVDRRNRAATDPARLDWDAYEPDLCLPDVWQPSWLATREHFGGTWPIGALSAPDGSEPVPGDRVVVYRPGPTCDVVGVWLITGASYGPHGAVRFGHRPLVSCLEPVALRPEVRYDADLAQCWDEVFGRASSGNGSFFPLVGSGLSAVIRTVGIDPQLLCGPANDLPDCSMSNVRPGPTYRPATYLRTVLSAEAAAERRGLTEAIDWLWRGWSAAGALFGWHAAPAPFAHIETVGTHGEGTCLVARAADHVTEVVAAGVVSPRFDDLTVCPSLVIEAAAAVEDGREWYLIVTLDALGRGRTLRFDAQAVALCFDPTSGRVNTAT